ncbi:hypothetical protein C8Q70DRAFT_935704 [Cubamyces menziesii]|nr:hypothetical protein C8Q70DRAFT_935704 [Cubamyces menziesii]
MFIARTPPSKCMSQADDLRVSYPVAPRILSIPSSWWTTARQLARVILTMQTTRCREAGNAVAWRGISVSTDVLELARHTWIRHCAGSRVETAEEPPFLAREQGGVNVQLIASLQLNLSSKREARGVAGRAWRALCLWRRIGASTWPLQIHFLQERTKAVLERDLEGHEKRHQHMRSGIRIKN